jgi:hypothetical protein
VFAYIAAAPRLLCRSHVKAALLVIVAIGCSEDRSCEAHWDPRCEHPIDRLVIPELRALGIEPREAEPAEYCRRLAIDLTGRVPTPGELAECVALPDAAARVDHVMASPRYLRTMRRAWGEHLAYNNFSGWSDEIVELDALVGRLYAGEVRYDAFASDAVVHPGFLGLHRYDDWAGALWRVFLGRPARADEIAGMRSLAYALVPRGFCEGHILAYLIDEALDEGLDPVDAHAQAYDVCLDLERAEWAVNFCACSAEAGGCATGVLGREVALAGACADPDDPYADANARRIHERVAGDSDECPDGTHRDECRDISTETFGKPVSLPLVDAAGRAELAKIGGALVERGDFWEAAVDREARLLLGWWQTSFRHPDTDLPDVRRVLADRLREHGSVREIHRLVLTSILYTAPAEAVEGVPDFAAAPTKLMAAENWLDSAALAVGEPTGVCDFRWVTPEGYYDSSLIDYRLSEETPYSIYDARLGDEAYYELAIKLGGCNAEARRPSLSSVGIAFTEATLARMLCAYGRGVVPADWDGELASGARHVIERVLGRVPDDVETGELVGEMQACLGAGGCSDPETALRWLCTRALESTEFSTY